MKRGVLGVVIVLASAQIVFTTGRPQTTADRVFTNPVFKWSVSCPEGWTVHAHDPAYVKMQAPEGSPSGLVGIRSMELREDNRSLDTLADISIAAESRIAGFRMLSRRRTTLADGTPAVEIITVLGHGVVGKSRKLCTVAGKHAFCLNAETYEDGWSAVEHHFEQIFRSFTPGVGSASITPAAGRSPDDGAKRFVAAGASHPGDPARAGSPEQLVDSSRRVIDGVPFIAWSEAAQLEYHSRAILNPSFAASLGMILQYWGQDLARLKKPEEALPAGEGAWGRTESTEAGGVSDLKAFIDRGIPVLVSPMLTPDAHIVNPVIPMMATLKGEHLTPAGPYSGSLGVLLPRPSFLEARQRFGRMAWESLFLAARVVIGYDDERRTIVLHDPSFGPAWEIDIDEFDRMWEPSDRHYMVVRRDDHEEHLAKRPPAAPYPAPSPDQRAAYLYVFGAAQAVAGRPAESEDLLRQALAVPGTSKGYRHLALFELAVAHAAAGRIPEAIARAEEAIVLVPEHHGPHRLLAQLHRASGGRRAEGRARDAEKQAGKLCRDERAQAAVGRALAHSFWIQGCQPGRLVAPLARSSREAIVKREIVGPAIVLAGVQGEALWPAGSPRAATWLHGPGPVADGAQSAARVPQPAASSWMVSTAPHGIHERASCSLVELLDAAGESGRCVRAGGVSDPGTQNGIAVPGVRRRAQRLGA
jgi:tetratricopeptide (TPR) repeat protein